MSREDLVYAQAMVMFFVTVLILLCNFNCCLYLVCPGLLIHCVLCGVSKVENTAT